MYFFQSFEEELSFPHPPRNIKLKKTGNLRLKKTGNLRLKKTGNLRLKKTGNLKEPTQRQCIEFSVKFDL